METDVALSLMCLRLVGWKALMKALATSNLIFSVETVWLAACVSDS